MMGVKEQTKFNLQEAFWDIYKEKPINKISIKEITDRAGYNRGTFYNYYTDVYDILNEIKQGLVPSEELISAVLQWFQDHDLGSITKEEKERARFEVEQSYDDELNEKMNERIMVLLGPNGDPDYLYEYKKEARTKVMEQVKDLNEKDRIKLEYIIEFLLSGIIHTWMLWNENNMNISKEEVDGMFDEISEIGFEKVLSDIFNNKK
ncbi:TetR/AcrR family transcriptional regulator [Oceanobacillus oncorhynchi]|uniref:TetR/AcrR family transcriptional regulator n=1 Tax=Oceanobacillus oncorhynchi TaxID=545501 RepID=UPI002F96E0A5